MDPPSPPSSRTLLIVVAILTFPKVMRRGINMKRVGRACGSVGLAASLVVGLGGCATTMRRPPSLADSLLAVSTLDEVVQNYTRFLFSSRPELASMTNVVATTLPDPSQDQAKREAFFGRATLSALDGVSVEALRQDDYVTWLSLRWELEAMSGWAAFHWTRLSDLAPGTSVFDRSSAILKDQHIANPAAGQRFRDLVTRVGDIARALRAEYMERAGRDIRLPQPVAQRAIAHLRGLIAPPELSPFGLPTTFQAPADTAWKTQLVRDVGDVIRLVVNPALDSLVALLEQENDRGSDVLGLARLPGGAAHYGALLRYHTTLDITPEEAHVIGVREVARIAALAAAARDAARLPVNRDSLRALLRSDPSFAFDERSSIPERTAELYASLLQELDSVIGPASGIPVAIGVTDSSTAAAPATYERPTATRPSARYLLNIEDLVSRSAIVLPGLVVGDLLGFHQQQATQLANTSLPTFRRLASHDGFVNGWQIYVLGVADSLSTTLQPWQRFGLRLRELAAACGLVIDTGINALGWTRADALNFLRAYLPYDDADLDDDFIFPASEMPGKLSSGALGARELRGLRSWVTRESGDRFRLAAFHAEVRRVGSVPLPVLGSHLEHWIWEQNQPAPPPAHRQEVTPSRR
jgi:uncharacterized protein (DUF885 family)